MQKTEKLVKIFYTSSARKNDILSLPKSVIFIKKYHTFSIANEIF